MPAGVKACALCGEKVRKEHAAKDTEEPFHQICFDVAVAAVTADLENHCRAQPEKYAEVRPGCFVERVEAQA